MSPSAIPLLSATGQPVFRRPVPYGDTLYFEFYVPVLVEDENAMWRAYYYFEHHEFKDGNAGAIEYVVEFVSDRFMNYLAPISLQGVLQKLRDYLGSFDLGALMPINIPDPERRVFH